METVEQPLIEAANAAERFWFIRTWQVIDRTNSTATVRFEIDTDFFVQVFLSERSDRLSLALIGASGPLYGRDRERAGGIATHLDRKKSTKQHRKVCPRILSFSL